VSIEAREARQPWILLTPALGAITLLLVIPLLFIVVYSFWLRSAVGPDIVGFHLDNWQRTLTDPFYRYILLNTLKTAAITTVMSWINILGTSGALNTALMSMGLISEPIRMLYNEATVILGLVHFLLPFMVLNIYVSLDGIDTNLEDAANSLGATRWQAFLQVTLPLSLPGLAAGGLLVFVLGGSSYITPLILGGPRDAMFANLVYEAIITQLNWPLGSALSIMLLIVLGALVLLYNRFLGLAQLTRGIG
jgi:spermidine/putrescine transport system permease protein